MNLRFLLCAALALAVSPAFSQSMYKWVDEKGVTHFSQDPPPDGNKNAQKIEVKTTQPDRPPADNWREREMQSKQLRAKKGVEEESARQREEAQRGQACRAAQRKADTMKNYARVFRLDEKGERVYYDEKQREAELAEAQREMAKYCN
jgi:hypothetical protein